MTVEEFNQEFNVDINNLIDRSLNRQSIDGRIYRKLMFLTKDPDKLYEWSENIKTDAFDVWLGNYNSDFYLKIFGNGVWVTKVDDNTHFFIGYL